MIVYGAVEWSSRGTLSAPRYSRRPLANALTHAAHGPRGWLDSTRPWFDRLPVHQRFLVLTTVAVALAVLVATTSLLGADILASRQAGTRDTALMATVLADGTAAAVMADDADTTATLLASMGENVDLARACLYLPDGALFAAYARDPGTTCPASSDRLQPITGMAATADVVWSDESIGRLHLERDVPSTGRQATRAAAAGLVVIALATGVTAVVARPATRRLARSLVDTERAARRAGRREASALTDEFLATVSHELRTPLNAIVGWSQILQHTPVDDDTRARAIATIARNAQAQTRVIEDLVDVSRLVTGRLRLRVSSVDLHEVVDAAIGVARPAAAARGVILTVDTPSTPCVVRGDRERLQRIVGNLLSNAITSSDPHGVVDVQLATGGTQHTIVVRDHGVGITPELLPFVFDRYKQVDRSPTRAHGGLGLGLTVVKRLTDLHGGTVTAASDGPGRGSTFEVRLPAAGTPAGPRLRHDMGDSAIPPLLTGVSVLIVDDNTDALDVLSATLTTAGADVRMASSGREALARWRQAPAQVLLCDIAMPDIDGHEVLRRIRESDARTGRFTPAVALSAHAGRDQVAHSVDAGFARHVTKPYVAADLVRTLREVADQPRARGTVA